MERMINTRYGQCSRCTRDGQGFGWVGGWINDRQVVREREREKLSARLGWNGRGADGINRRPVKTRWQGSRLWGCPSFGAKSRLAYRIATSTLLLLLPPFSFSCLACSNLSSHIAIPVLLDGLPHRCAIHQPHLAAFRCSGD